MLPEHHEAEPRRYSLDAHSHYVLHIIAFVLIVVLCIERVVLAFVPGNVLYNMGLGNAVAIDFTLGTLLALGIAIFSLVNRKTCPSVVLFGLTQFLAWMDSVGFVLFLVAMAVRALRMGGV